MAETKTIIVHFAERRFDVPESWDDQDVVSYLDSFIDGEWLDFKYEEDWRN